MSSLENNRVKEVMHCTPIYTKSRSFQRPKYVLYNFKETPLFGAKRQSVGVLYCTEYIICCTRFDSYIHTYRHLQDYCIFQNIKPLFIYLTSRTSSLRTIHAKRICIHLVRSFKSDTNLGDYTSQLKTKSIILPSWRRAWIPAF